MTTTETRGIRNRNPGNIDYSPANHWKGQLKPDLSVERRFARFDTHENGIRALGKLLLTYQRKHKLKTVKAIINRWAPTVENDTRAYVSAVEQSIGACPGAEIDLAQYEVLEGFIKAIIHHENGGFHYPSQVVAEGVRRALA